MDLPPHVTVEALDDPVLCPECKTASQKKDLPSQSDTIKSGVMYRGLQFGIL